MSSYNRVVLVGNLGANPEIRTAGQTPVATLAVATTSFGKGADGEKKEFTEWHRIKCFGKLGENCAKFLTKGKKVLVEGSLRTNKWTDKEGVERYTTEIVASDVQFLSPKGASATGNKVEDDDFVGNPTGVAATNPSLDDIPF